jgi:hypothetical protein
LGLFDRFFGKAKARSQDSIIEAAERLGIPVPEAQKILETEMNQLSQLLAATILPQCTIKNLPVHERMAHCVKIVYGNLQKKQAALQAQQTSVDPSDKSTDSDFKDGVAALEKEDYSVAILKFKLAAARGDAAAQRNIGDMYGIGLGLPQDYAEAFNWFKLAAEQGDAEAQVNIGVMYGQGQGCIQSHAEALKWFKPAAVQGNSDAQYNIGGSFATGRGVKQDYVRAHMWFELAAAGGDIDAVKGMGRMAAKLTSQQISEAENLANKCRVSNFKDCD